MFPGAICAFSDGDVALTWEATKKEEFSLPVRRRSTPNSGFQFFSEISYVWGWKKSSFCVGSGVLDSIIVPFQGWKISRK